MGVDLGESLELERRIRRHPALALAVAAGAGLVVGTGLGPSLARRPGRVLRLVGWTFEPLGGVLHLAALGGLVGAVRALVSR